MGAVTEYDSLGRVWRTSTPYLTTATYTGDTTGISDWTVNEYDTWDRIVKVTAPDGSISSTDIDIVNFQMQVTGKDPNYHANEPWRGKHVRIADGFGRTVEVQDYNVDTLYSTTHYEYDLMGELKNLRDNVGNITTLTYNRLGWKKTIDDPDKGYVSYDYDNMGNLRYQTDNKRQQVWNQRESRYHVGQLGGSGADTVCRMARRRASASSGRTGNTNHSQHAEAHRFHNVHLRQLSPPSSCRSHYRRNHLFAAGH